MKTYCIWKCNQGGLWMYRPKGENPPKNSNGVPINDYELIEEFEAEENASTELFHLRLTPHLEAFRKSMEPTVEQCLETIAQKDKNVVDRETHSASPEDLGVGAACQYLFKYKVHKDVVESVLEWMESNHVRSIIKSCLKRWND